MPKEKITQGASEKQKEQTEKKQTNKQKKGKNNILAHDPFCTLT